MAFTGTLMSGNTPVAGIVDNRVTPILKERMPLYLSIGGPLDRWLESRAIDRHRPNSRLLKKVLRLTDTGDVAAVLYANAATITDNYWLRSVETPNLTWEQVRFSENHFAELALRGDFHSYGKVYTPEQLRSNTPELTNTGSFEKCWRLEDGCWWLYKQGTPLERFSELFIAGLGQALGLSMAKYLPDGNCVKSKDFTGGNLNYEPASALMGEEEDYGYNCDRIAALDPALIPQYLDILYLDALCFNMDRHTENYGFLRDQLTGKVCSMAPNFDNNIALISRGYGEKAVGSNGLLMDLFVDVLKERRLSYTPPKLEESTVQRIAESTIPKEEINRGYVVGMVMDRYRRLEQSIGQLEQHPGLSGMDMK